MTFGRGRVSLPRRPTPTDEGAAGFADFAGRTGCDDFDPTRPLPVKQHASIFDAIVTTPAKSRGYQGNRSTSTELIIRQKLGWIVSVAPGRDRSADLAGRACCTGTALYG